MKELHQVGDIIGDRYEIVKFLGQGSMGTTYAATDRDRDFSVALKVVSLKQMKEWKILELFEREARFLANLNHPAIPNYLDYFQLDTPGDRRFYLVQELVEGQSLTQLVESGWHCDEAEVCRIAAEVLKILDYLHHLNPPVIHRDIKPQNIIRRSDGRIYLVDFGAVGDLYRRNLVRGGTFVGTLGYMPPEQCRGRVFLASDLYALGTTLLFLLTHRSPEEIPHNRLKIDFRSRVHISPELAGWLERAIEPAVEDRFHSAREALKVLQAIAEPRLQLRPPPENSRIILKRSDRRLVLNIPPVGLRNNKYWAYFSILWNVLLLGLTFAVFFEAISLGDRLLFLVLLILPEWVVGVLLLRWLSWAIAGRVEVEIDRDTARIRWECLGVSHTVREPISGLVASEIGLGKHAFAYGFSWEERDWLRSELSVFLTTLKYARSFGDPEN